MALTERLALLVDARVDGAVRDIKTLAKESGRTDDQAKKLEARGKAIGTAWKVGAGVVATAALVKLGQVSKEAVQDASSLNEQQNKANVVFGEAAAQIRKFGDEASDSLHISERAALAAASGFGLFFKAAGQSDDAAADMSTTMVKLSADMASFNEADPSEVLENLRSGLSGESEPLRKFGVFLNESAVAAKAAELGLEGLNGKLTDGEKIQARYAIILEQTAMQQGDLARTADSLANTQNKATAKAEEARAALGEGLLPAQLALTTALVDAAPAITAVARGVGSLVSGFTKLPGPVQALVGGTAALGGGFLFLAPRIKDAKELLGSFSAEGGKAKSTMVGLGKAAGTAAIAIGALEILNELQPDEAAVGRFVEKLEALAGSDIDAKIAAITAEIEKQQAVVGDAFGPQFELFGAEVAPLEFGDDFKVAAANVDALKERLAELKHQKELDAIASGQATDGTKTLAGAMGDAAAKADRAEKRQEALAEALKESRSAARETANGFVGLGESLDDNEVSLKGWLREMEKSAEALRNFEDNARKAARRGLHEGLIAALQEAGPEGAMRMRQLANATDAEIKRASAAWHQGRDAVNDYTDAIGGVPKQRTTRLDVIVDTSQLDSLQYRLGRLAAGYKVPIKTIAEPRARGGPVTGGETYLVGEEGPELFTPRTSGSIIPNGALGRSSGGGGRVADNSVMTYARTLDKASKMTERHAQTLLRSADEIRDGIADKIRNLKQERGQIAGSFASSFGQNVFGSEASSVTDILSLAGKQASDADAINKAVTALIGKGVSEGVLQDLLAGGQAGFDQIKLLAGADKAQLTEFNKLTQIADANLAAAGGKVGGALLNDDIAAAQRDLKSVERITKAFEDALRKHDENTTVIVQIGEEKVLSVLRRIRRNLRDDLGL